MNTNKLRTGAFAVALAVTGALGLGACASDDANGSGAEEVNVDVAEDLQGARAAVEDALADDPSWTQVMLASDVDAPTQKYGLLVMPFVASDAVANVTGTVNIDGGNYTIEAESAETELVWQIDQDGDISEVTE